MIIVECTDNRTGRMFQPSSSTDPYVQNPLSWKVSAQTLTGSSATAQTITHAVTNPQWNVTGSVSVKDGGKVLGFGVEATENGQVARQGQITAKTTQSQETVTIPTQIVYGCELHRTQGRPDLGMNVTRPATAYA